MATWSAPQIPPFRPRARTTFWNYPRPYRTGWKAWLPSWRFIVGTMLAGASVVAGVLMAAWTSITIPAELDNMETTTVRYAGDGGKLGEFRGDEDRKIVTVEELPIWVANAAVASEDRGFYAENNLGISPSGIARAAITGVGGGSTLTQQYVEQAYTSWNPNPTYVDKFEEMILAMKIRQDPETYPPEEILGEYLNRIYLGRSAYGIQTAAQAYYGKDAKNLTPSEAAFLAGIIPSPNAYDDTDWGRAWAENRWERTLYFMHEDEYIDDEQYDKAVAEGFPKPQKHRQSSAYSGPKGYILKEVERELQANGFNLKDLYQDGLVVHTTIDKKLQKAANETAKLPKDANTPLTRSALVSIDPKTGAIRAMYGGPDKSKPEYDLNAATDNWQQGGSTNKPFTLIAALDQGISLGTQFNGDEPQTFDYYTKKNPDTGLEEPAEVTNFDNKDFGNIDLVEATANSVNTVYVQLNNEVTPQATQEVAKKLGLDVEGSIAYRKNPENPGETTSQMSNVLGTSYVYTVDLARAYATIANQGVRTTPHLVDKVVNPDTGEVVYQSEVTEERVFDKEIMAGATYAMSQVIDDENGSGHYARQYIPDRPLAGKTGTSNDNYAAWFAGFTPQLVTVVNTYQYDPAGRDGKGEFQQITPFGGFTQMTGGTWPVQAWTSFMVRATEGMPVEQFPEYEYEEPEPSHSPTPTDQPETVMVPTGLVGRGWEDARNALTSVGLNAQPQEIDSELPPGTVIAVQNEGQEVPVPSTIVVQISKGPGQDMVAVPSVVTLSEQEANSTLRSSGFDVNVERQAHTEPEGTVIQQDPGPGIQAQRGSTVTIWVSDGSLSDPSDGATCGVFQNQPCDDPTGEPTGGATEEPGPGGGNRNGNGSEG
ncbi:transglycosylase domain-containing protein [Myceligenerans pegani]|uniref:Transglycosylase domain-containing protein n=1 Tax=Myceligenerans pegani TaxID=2776917 RepID=A0ABR9N3K9_9MICO|nr:transglycosylase domain-containing protein [Myceligenerans sp. TRM 65318]MBE1877930.1 transglycosylase domain-containing protein [Myceligenerans sp. TRM 65318]MBE3020201.1 transglycosylase domain-containing protein [Myceligenerans sp. TRM 65318]